MKCEKCGFDIVCLHCEMVRRGKNGGKLGGCRTSKKKKASGQLNLARAREILAFKRSKKTMDIQEIISKEFKGRKPIAWDVNDLIAKVKKYQTPEMIEYFKSLEPTAGDVRWLIVRVKKYQTPEWIEYFKSLEPAAGDVRWLIARVEKYQTSEWIEYFKSLKPDAWDVRWLIKEVPSLEKYFN
jgi:hypothetical protein